MVRFPSRSLALGAVAALLLTLVAAVAPSPAAAAGLISLRSHVCPATYDGAAASIYDLAANCHGSGAGVTVALGHDRTPVTSGTTDANGWINFSNFQPGEAEIDQTAPFGYFNRAFCALYTDNDSGAHTYYEYQNPVIQLINATQNFDCDFFNVIAVPLQTTTVYVNKHNCPSGFDAKNADIYGLAAGCNASGGDGVTFRLAPSDGQTYPAVTSTGIASWQNVAAGPLTITETYPPGFVAARVFCNTKNPQTETGFSEYPVDPSGLIAAAATAGSDFYCDWFDIPPSTVTVTVTKYDCPLNASNDPASFSNLLQLCALMSNVNFSLFPVNGAELKGTTDAQGISAWTNIPADEFTLQESLPNGYGLPSVACKIGDLASAPAQVMTVADGPSVNLVVAAGQEASCIWFNIPEPPTPTATPTSTPVPIVNTPVVITTNNATATPTPKTAATAKLIIEKFTCKPGYDVFAKDADPKTDCPDATAKIEFTLSGGKTPVKQKTGADGTVSFTKVKAGHYQIAETLPREIASAFLGGCDSTTRDLSSYPFTPFAVISATGTLGVQLDAGETLNCRWYDVPARRVSTAAVTITVLTCPGQSVVLAQCTPGASGIQFTLTPSGTGGTAVTLATDATGIATGKVSAGTYQLEELGTNWCLADSSAFDPTAHLTVGSAAVTVSIYNCGA